MADEDYFSKEEPVEEESIDDDLKDRMLALEKAVSSIKFDVGELIDTVDILSDEYYKRIGFPSLNHLEDPPEKKKEKPVKNIPEVDYRIPTDEEKVIKKEPDLNQKLAALDVKHKLETAKLNKKYRR